MGTYETEEEWEEYTSSGFGLGAGLLQGAIGNADPFRRLARPQGMSRCRTRAWAVRPSGDGGSCPWEWLPVLGSRAGMQGQRPFMARYVGLGCCCGRLRMVLGGLWPAVQIRLSQWW
jgi:hypothetical protein